MIEPYIRKLDLKLTPHDAFIRLQSLPGILFFDGDQTTSEYAFITADPFYVVEDGKINEPIPKTNTLETLKTEFRKWSVKPTDGVPPFQGGIGGFLGYGFSKQLEKLPPDKDSIIHSPNIHLGFYDWVISYDFRKKQMWLVSTGFPETVEHSRITRAISRSNMVIKLLEKPETKGTNPSSKYKYSYKKPERLLRLFDNEHFYCDNSADDYMKSVKKSIDYINAGDSFQINLSQRFWHPKFCDDISLYDSLIKVSPAPFACYISTPSGTIISASPERFLTLRGNKVVTSPIKGTRPRGKTPEEDEALALALLNSPKDRAENIMIVDLLRNDLGRVCSYGSIQVEEICKLESYSNVHHLVSKVTGKLIDGSDGLDLLLACFPGGSVTGAPKIRSMEIIAELETSPRGIYCGSAGYIGFDGTMDTNILIRTIFSSGDWLQFGAGGGIVADSIPNEEYNETLNKASGIIKAIRSHEDLARLFRI